MARESVWRWSVIALIAIMLAVHILIDQLFHVRLNVALIFLSLIAAGTVGWLGMSACRLLLMSRRERRMRIEIFETNFGRQGGWIVEREGRPVAVLSDPRRADMFWYSYAVQWLTDDAAEQSELLAAEPCLWWGRQLKFRNREFSAVIENAFAAGPPIGGRVFMRGLHIPLSGPCPWERLVLWWRGRKGARRTRCST